MLITLFLLIGMFSYRKLFLRNCQCFVSNWVPLSSVIEYVPRYVRNSIKMQTLTPILINIQLTVAYDEQ